MSLEAVQMIIGRAAMDAEFRKLLIENAAQACEGYDLTKEELDGGAWRPLLASYPIVSPRAQAAG